MNRTQALEKILKERERQESLPGSEFDIKHSPNDWIAKIAHYSSEHSKRNAQNPSKEEFETALIKAGAVIVAALEHISVMSENNHLKK